MLPSMAATTGSLPTASRGFIVPQIKVQAGHNTDQLWPNHYAGLDNQCEPRYGDLVASTYSGPVINAHPVTFYRSTDEGNTWTMIPSGHLSAATAQTGCIFPGRQYNRMWRILGACSCQRCVDLHRWRTDYNQRFHRHLQCGQCVWTRLQPRNPLPLAGHRNATQC